MDLTILGSSPATENAGGACSGYLVSTGHTRLLVDCGHGVVSVLREVTELKALSAILISHMHPDHFFDLVPLAYGFLFGKVPSIPLFLPPDGAQTLHDLAAAVRLPEGFFERLFQISTYDPTASLRCGEVTITFAHTRHAIPAYAMRFVHDGRALFYSSDTAPDHRVAALMQDADVALVEATAPLYSEDSDSATIHLDAPSAGRRAREAGVRALILTHTWYPVAAETLSLGGEAFGGPISLARERSVYRV